VRRVYLDTCCVIYLLEEAAGLSDAMRAFLARHDDVLLCVSPLVRLEALIKPLHERAHDLVRDYEDFLAAQQWLPVNDAVFDRAMGLRVKQRLRTPDALHLALATHYGCDEFWTNDNRLSAAAGAMAVNIFG